MQNWKNTSKIILVIGVIGLVLGCNIDEVKESTASNSDTNFKNTENVWWNNKKTISGKALGTSFVIKTSDDSLLTNPIEIDRLLSSFNLEMSTYIDSSVISSFNKRDSIIDLTKSTYFQDCFELSQTIYQQTDGAFDPTVYPLVSLWGFFKDIDEAPKDAEIDSVLAFVGLNENAYTYDKGVLHKKDKRFKLVFNAIAKGQAVDVVAEYLNEQEQGSYFIEIGGEIRVKGENDHKRKWVIGIDEPVESNTGLEGTEERVLENYIEVTDKAVATSGNYREFYELDGRKYSHTLSPITGKPVRHNLLSVTVIADDAASADAYATAFMVMGVEPSLKLIKENSDIDIDAYLLFENEQGRIERAYSDGMYKYLMD